MTDTSPQALKDAERMRLQYLQLLGITSYYPRVELPGAAPSSILPGFPEPPAASVEPAASVAVEALPVQPEPLAEPETGRELPGQRLEALLERTESLLGPESNNSAPATSRQTENQLDELPEQESGPELRCHLLLLAAEGGLAICNRLPELAAAGSLAGPELKLLQNILHWLGTPLRGDIHPRHFRWPLPGFDGGSAVLALGGFLGQARAELGFDKLLWMDSSEDGVSALLQEQSGFKRYSTPSLSEMLALPALKREAWQSLLPLQAALQQR